MRHVVNTQWDFLCDIKIPNYTLRLIKHPKQEKYGWLLPLNLIQNCYSKTRSKRYFSNYRDAQKNLLEHLKSEAVDVSRIDVVPSAPRKAIQNRTKKPQSNAITLTKSQVRPVYNCANKKPVRRAQMR